MPPRTDYGDISERYKVTVMGEGGVGKTAITLGLVHGVFREEYDPTIEDSYLTKLTIDGKDCVINLIDTAGQEEFRTIVQDRFLRTSDAFLLVFSVIRRDSFKNLAEYRDTIMRSREDALAPIVVVGNKKDMEQEREVTAEEGKRFALSCGSAHYIETSAKTRLNIEDLFLTLVRELRKAKKQAAKKDGDEDATASKGKCKCVIL